MNKEETIRILNIATEQYRLFIEDNCFRYKLQNKKTPTREYSEIIEHHNKLIEDLNQALDYIKENLN